MKLSFAVIDLSALPDRIDSSCPSCGSWRPGCEPVPPFPQEPALGSPEAMAQAGETIRGFASGTVGLDALADPEIVVMQVGEAARFCLMVVALSSVACLTRAEWESHEGHGAWIDELASIYRSRPESLPLIVVRRETTGGFSVLDGGHRASGAKEAGLQEVAVYVFADDDITAVGSTGLGECAPAGEVPGSSPGNSHPTSDLLRERDELRAEVERLRAESSRAFEASMAEDVHVRSRMLAAEQQRDALADALEEVLALLPDAIRKRPGSATIAAAEDALRLAGRRP